MTAALAPGVWRHHGDTEPVDSRTSICLFCTDLLTSPNAEAPHISGQQLARHWRSHTPDVVAAATTGHDGSCWCHTCQIVRNLLRVGLR